MLFVPIKGNRNLLLAGYSVGKPTCVPYLHLSIYEIRSDQRVGPALWYFNSSDDRLHTFQWKLIKSTNNALGITLWARFDDHWKLFDISTTETDTSNNFSLVELGRIDFDAKFNSRSLLDPRNPGLFKIFMQLC